MKLVVAWLRDLDHYVSREFAYVIRGLIDEHGWRHVELETLQAGKGGLRDRLVAAVGEMPEVLLFWEGYGFIREHADEIGRLGCLTAVFSDDLYGPERREHWSQRLAFMVCDLALAAYGHLVEDRFPGAGAKTVWVPHSASPDFFLPFHDRAENAVFLSGALSHHYPLRRALKAVHETGRYPIVHAPHPGYECRFDHRGDARVGLGFARTIRRYRTAFSDGLIYGYVVAKFFEIPATGALLLADRSVAGPLARLGYVADVHYVAVGPDDLEDRLRDVLDPSRHGELDAVRRRGQALVGDRHKTSDRAALIDATCRAKL